MERDFVFLQNFIQSNIVSAVPDLEKEYFITQTLLKKNALGGDGDVSARDDRQIIFK